MLTHPENAVHTFKFEERFLIKITGKKQDYRKESKSQPNKYSDLIEEQKNEINTLKVTWNIYNDPIISKKFYTTETSEYSK